MTSKCVKRALMRLVASENNGETRFADARGPRRLVCVHLVGRRSAVLIGPVPMRRSAADGAPYEPLRCTAIVNNSKPPAAREPLLDSFPSLPWPPRLIGSRAWFRCRLRSGFPFKRSPPRTHSTASERSRRFHCFH